MYFLYPETKGLSLEQIDHIFEGQGNGWSCFTQGVKESSQGDLAIEASRPDHPKYNTSDAASDKTVTTAVAFEHPNLD